MAVPLSPTLTVKLLVVEPVRVKVYCPGFGVVPSRVSAASASVVATVITGKVGVVEVPIKSDQPPAILPESPPKSSIT